MFFSLLISMPRFQSINFCPTIGLIAYQVIFAQTLQNLQGMGLRPRPPCLQWLGALPLIRPIVGQKLLLIQLLMQLP